jgi:hypothetical protein
MSVADYLQIKRWLVPLLLRPRVAHAIKYTVYAGLLLMFASYIRDDLLAFRSTLPPDASVLDVILTFSTTIDMLGWVALVALFELETYAISEEAWTRVIEQTLRTLRILCYLLVGWAAYGYTVEALETFNVTPIAGVSAACDLADTGTWMQLDVREYVEISAENCDDLSDESVFYTIEGEVAAIGTAVLGHIQAMGWVDIVNAFVWIIVVLLIEVEVRLQSADRFSSPVLKLVRQFKTVFYLVLIGNSLIWLYYGYYTYTIDAFLWIFGFWAIELNLAEWEQERLEELSGAPARP